MLVAKRKAAMIRKFLAHGPRSGTYTAPLVASSPVLMSAVTYRRVSLPATLAQHHVTGMTLDQGSRYSCCSARTADRFPMARHRPIFNRRRR